MENLFTPNPDQGDWPRRMRDPLAWLSEVFISRQGEAKFQGERQLFIRVGACPLRCQYCDQPEALVKEPRFRVEKSAGGREFTTYKNPVHPGGLWQMMQRFQGEFSNLHSVSITGGEPLLYPHFIRELIPFLKSVGLKIFLETAGVHTEALKKISRGIDIISMDIKIPSSTRENWRLEEHREFLLEARRKDVDLYAKIVISEDSSMEEMQETGRMLAQVAPEIEVFLQELWPVHPNDKKPTLQTLQSLQREMEKFVPRVFLSRQQHKIENIL